MRQSAIQAGILAFCPQLATPGQGFFFVIFWPEGHFRNEFRGLTAMCCRLNDKAMTKVTVIKVQLV